MLTSSNLWLWKESFYGQYFVPRNIDGIALLEAVCYHTFSHLDGEIDFVYRSQNLVHFAYNRFVLKIDWSVEIRNFIGHYGRAEHLVFDSVYETTHG